jgi:hypothetical protein
MGLGARAMNLPITINESNAGLVPPAVATMLLGAGGAFLLVFQVRARAVLGMGFWHSNKSRPAHAPCRVKCCCCPALPTRCPGVRAHTLRHRLPRTNLQLWMAVTASGSAEQIAVSSLIAYDVYK